MANCPCSTFLMGAAMEPFHLRMKIGAHEFEAEGDQESVERQFATWRELIASAPSPSASSTPPPPLPHNTGTPDTSLADNSGTTGLRFDPTGFEKIIHRDGKMLSLSVLPPGENREADAALVLLVAHKVYNNLDQVSGG